MPIVRARLSSRFLPSAVSIVLGAVLLASALTARAQIMTPVQTYYVPIEEVDIRRVLAFLNPNDTDDEIESVVSITIAFAGTVVVYDQSENGYEVDISNPVDVFSAGNTDGTQIWGDGDPANGAAPGFPGDLLSDGDVIVLQNTVPANPPGAGILFDAGDKFAVSGPVAVSRVGWADPPGTVLAGAVEVFPTSEWGLTFEAPIGEDIASDSMFEWVGASFMAMEDDTVLTFDVNNNGIFEPPPGGEDFVITLDEGESFLGGFDPLMPFPAPPADVVFPLATRTNSSKPLQVHGITGDIGAVYESRWAVILPLERWSDEYFVPVGTQASDPTDVFLYNPDPVDTITVMWATAAGAQTDISLGPRSVARRNIPDGEGARFFSHTGLPGHAPGPPFYGVATVDASTQAANNQNHDWGFAIGSIDELSTQALVGFAPGIDPNACAAGAPFDCPIPAAGPGSPVFVMAADPDLVGTTTVFVDFDADPDTGPLTDTAGNSYNIAVDLSALEAAKIFDPDDNDMTGALLYTLDGTLIATVWGQDPANSAPANPYFDVGTVVPALPVFTLVKDVSDAQALEGATLTYTIVVTNTSRSTIPDVLLEDVLPPFTTYIPNSSTLNAVAFPDDGVGTAFPLDEGGSLLGQLEPEDVHTFTFQVLIDADVPLDEDDANACPFTQTSLINEATASALSFTETDDALTCVLEPGIDIEKQTNGSDADGANDADVPVIAPLDPVNWTYLATNTGNVDFAFADVDVSDDQPGVTLVFDAASDVGSDGILSPGEQWTYTASQPALDLSTNPPGVTIVMGCDPDSSGDPREAYENLATAVAPGASDNDPSHYCNPPDPGIDIEKLTNAFDADGENDADVPQILPGATVDWTYLVTNTGDVDFALADVAVSDDQLGVTPLFDATSDVGSDGILSPGEQWMYTASQPALNLSTSPPGVTIVMGCDPDSSGDPREAYENVATAVAPGASDNDPSHYCNPPDPGIDIEKLTNGNQADNPDFSPIIAPGVAVTWTYLVTNTGDVDFALADVVVSDDQSGVTPLFDATSDVGSDGILSPGEQWTYTASQPALDLSTNPPGVTIVLGCDPDSSGDPREAYENVATAVAPGASDNDPSHYCNPPEPDIDIEKLTNGSQADNPDFSPVIAPGVLVTWTYLVTNTGDVDFAFADVTVTDDQLGVVPVFDAASDVGSDGVLSPTEVWTYSASAPALDLAVAVGVTVVPGCGDGRLTYENLGTVVVPGEQDSDPSHYCNPPPTVVIEKRTNGFDADGANDADVPEIVPGAPVTWSYLVTNTGPVSVLLADVVVTDDQPGVMPIFDAVSDAGSDSVLSPGEQWTYSASAPALDLTVAVGVTVVPGCGDGRPTYENLGTVVVPGGGDSDPSHYCNPAEPEIEIQKSTQGVDADNPNGAGVPQIGIGEEVSWRYRVENTGDVKLVDVVVVDDHGTPGNPGDDLCTPNAVPLCANAVISCPRTMLEPGQSMSCTASDVALDLANPPAGFVPVSGLCGGIPNSPLYGNMGTASAESETGESAQDVDASHYCNAPPRTVCVATDRVTSLTPKQTKIFNVENFFNVNPAACPTGFVVAYAKNDTLGAKQPISFNHLTGASYIRGSGSGRLLAGAERAFTVQSPQAQGVAVGVGGAFPDLPFDGISYNRIPLVYSTDFRASEQGGGKGSVLTLLNLDINRTLQNDPTLVAVDASNQAEVGFSGSLEFSCHIRLPVEDIPGIGGSLLKNSFGSSFGQIVIENASPDSELLALMEEIEPNRRTLRKFYHEPLAPVENLAGAFAGEKPGSVVVYPLFNVHPGFKTTIRLSNLADEEVAVQFFRVCGEGAP